MGTIFTNCMMCLTWKIKLFIKASFISFYTPSIPSSVTLGYSKSLNGQSMGTRCSTIGGMYTGSTFSSVRPDQNLWLGEGVWRPFMWDPPPLPQLLVTRVSQITPASHDKAAHMPHRVKINQKICWRNRIMSGPPLQPRSSDPRYAIWKN